MQAILIHGMGRTPLSMVLLAYRLHKAGMKISLFWYCVMLERFKPCVNRLKRFIEQRVKDDKYIIVAHSLGSVLSREAVPLLSYKPSAVFFLAPPTIVCQIAQRLRFRSWYLLLAGEMGQLLADSDFMTSLPPPSVPTYIYSGNAGLSGRFSPFGGDPNDGILAVKETHLKGALCQTVPSLHTFIMNNPLIAKNIIKEANKYYS